MLIQTKDGLIPLEELDVRDVTELQENARVTATEWYRNGELVRRDVHVNVLRGLQVAAEANL